MECMTHMHLTTAFDVDTPDKQCQQVNVPGIHASIDEASELSENDGGRQVFQAHDLVLRNSPHAGLAIGVRCA